MNERTGFVRSVPRESVKASGSSFLDEPTDNDSYACHPLRYSRQPPGRNGWKGGGGGAVVAGYASSSLRRKRPLHARDRRSPPDRRGWCCGFEEYGGISMRKGCLKVWYMGAGEEPEPKGWTIPRGPRVMERLPIPPDRIDETLIRVEWPDPTGECRPVVRGAP